MLTLDEWAERLRQLYSSPGPDGLNYWQRLKIKLDTENAQIQKMFEQVKVSGNTVRIRLPVDFVVNKNDPDKQ